MGVAAQESQNCSWKKLKEASLHHSLQQVVDATLGRRENKPAILLIQISRCLQKCGSKHKRGIFTKEPAMRALQLRVKKDGTLPTNPTDNEKQVQEGHEPTAGHSYWFSDNPKWLISA